MNNEEPSPQSLAPTLAHIPPGIVSLADHEAHAQTVLDAKTWAYLSGGAGDELTLRANRSSWDALTLQPRVLRSLAGGNLRTTLLGRPLDHPILVAPLAYQRLVHPEGELAIAYAAAAQNAGFVLSTQATTAMETIADAVRNEPGRGPLWFQLYIQPDRGLTHALVQRAEQAGYEALAVTVDAPSNGVRDRERRAGFKLPSGISAVNLAGMPPPHTHMARTGMDSLFDGAAALAPTWDDIAALQSRTRLPILLKGILHPDDAAQAAAMGCAGVIVSNHGGRTLDTAPATSVVLPRIVQAVRQVDARCAVLVDGGIRRGTDILKAIALGANAVLVGRPISYGLANAGAVGVAHVLRLLRDELEIAMAQCGCTTLNQATPALVSPL